MNKNMTELIFILDRSGSMCGLEAETIGGYNGLLEKQRTVPGEALVTTVLFDNEYELLHNRRPLQSVLPISQKEYFVRGSTALLDAVGRTMKWIGEAHKRMPKEKRPNQVMFVIVTDGMENSSHHFTIQQIRETIARKQEKKGWEFLFLGANMDAVETAEDFGILASRAATYRPDSVGTALNYQVLDKAIAGYRKKGMVDDGWAEEISKDIKKRERKS